MKDLSSVWLLSRLPGWLELLQDQSGCIAAAACMFVARQTIARLSSWAWGLSLSGSKRCQTRAMDAKHVMPYAVWQSNARTGIREA